MEAQLYKLNQTLAFQDYRVTFMCYVAVVYVCSKKLPFAKNFDPLKFCTMQYWCQTVVQNNYFGHSDNWGNYGNSAVICGDCMPSAVCIKIQCSLTVCVCVCTVEAPINLYKSTPDLLNCTKFARFSTAFVRSCANLNHHTAMERSNNVVSPCSTTPTKTLNYGCLYISDM